MTVKSWSSSEGQKSHRELIKQELGLGDAETPRVSLIKGQFRRHYEAKVKGRAKTKSNFRLILIFIALCLLAYYMLN